MRAVAAALTVALAAAGGAGAVTPPRNAVPKQDVRSTRSFLSSSLRVNQVELADAPAERVAAATLTAQVSTGCPAVLSGFPTNPKLGPTLTLLVYSLEFDSVFEIDTLQPVRPALTREFRMQARLSFSDPILSYRVDTAGLGQATLLALRPADLCADARAFASSHFERLTPAGERFIDNVTSVIGGETGPVQLARQMRAYAPATVAAAIARLNTQQRRINSLLEPEANALGRALFGVTAWRRVNGSPSSPPGKAPPVKRLDRLEHLF